MREYDAKRRLWIALPWLIVAVCLGLGYQTMRPPAPASSPAATDFSADRAFAQIRTIAVAPHPMGSTDNARVRDYIRSTLNELGVAVEMQEVIAPDYFGQGEPVAVVNVIGRIPGTASTGAIALMAHYDTVPATTGANDNSAAVATLLETARALLAGPPLANDVLLLFTDAEEPSPRYGASALVADLPVVAEIKLVVNFEATGSTGPSLLVETSGAETWLIDRLARTRYPAAFSFLTETGRLLGDIGTDFDEFRNRGIPGMHFAYLHNSSIYHTDADNLASVDLASLQHHGAHALGISRQLGSEDLSQPREPDTAVFFSLWSITIDYARAWVIPVMMIAVAGLLSGFVHRFRHNGLAAEARGVAVAFAGLLGAAVIGSICWVVIADARPTLGLLEGYFYFAGIVILVGGGMLWLSSRFPALAPGGHTPLLLWLMLTLLTAFLGIGYSYLFVWPALAAGIAVWWKAGGMIPQTLRFALVALVTAMLTVPPIDVFLQLAHPRPGNPDSSLPVVVLVPLFLTLLVAGFLRFFWPRPGRSIA